MTLSFNKSMQAYMLPAYQLTGVGMIIALLFTVLSSDVNLPVWLYAFVASLCFQCVCFNFAMMDLCSRCLLLSKSFLSAMRKPANGSKEMKKYLASMRPLRIYLGPFHIVDRSRGPITLRFCLQRTFFLVVKSKS